MSLAFVRPVTDGFHSQRASDAGSVSMWWRNHGIIPSPPRVFPEGMNVRDDLTTLSASLELCENKRIKHIHSKETFVNVQIIVIQARGAINFMDSILSLKHTQRPHYYQQGRSEGFHSCDRSSNLTQIGFNSSFFFGAYDLHIWWMTSK